jgi:hypothetical protein
MVHLGKSALEIDDNDLFVSKKGQKNRTSAMSIFKRLSYVDSLAGGDEIL